MPLLVQQCYVVCRLIPARIYMGITIYTSLGEREQAHYHQCEYLILLKQIKKLFLLNCHIHVEHLSLFIYIPLGRLPWNNPNLSVRDIVICWNRE